MELVGMCKEDLSDNNIEDNVSMGGIPGYDSMVMATLLCCIN